MLKNKINIGKTVNLVRTAGCNGKLYLLENNPTLYCFSTCANHPSRFL